MQKVQRTYIYCNRCKTNQEPRVRRWCNSCYRELMAFYRERGSVKKYYTICSSCGCQMEERTHAYCKECIKKYYKTKRNDVRKVKENKKKILPIKEFVDRVVSDNYDIELKDIVLIIDYYYMLATKSYEYDNMPSGSQIYHMFHYIKNSVEKIEI